MYENMIHSRSEIWIDEIYKNIIEGELNYLNLALRTMRMIMSGINQEIYGSSDTDYKK